MRFVRLSFRHVDKSTGVKCDQIIRLKNKKVFLSYPDKIRRIKFYDSDIETEFIFITNNFEISALEIARLYKYFSSLTKYRNFSEILSSKNLKVRCFLADTTYENLLWDQPRGVLVILFLEIPDLAWPHHIQMQPQW
jgi:hypothetical protein